MNNYDKRCYTKPTYIIISSKKNPVKGYIYVGNRKNVFLNNIKCERLLIGSYQQHDKKLITKDDAKNPLKYQNYSYLDIILVNIL